MPEWRPGDGMVPRCRMVPPVRNGTPVSEWYPGERGGPMPATVIVPVRFRATEIGLPEAVVVECGECLALVWEDRIEEHIARVHRDSQ